MDLQRNEVSLGLRKWTPHMEWLRYMVSIVENIGLQIITSRVFSGKLREEMKKKNRVTNEVLKDR